MHVDCVQLVARDLSGTGPLRGAVRSMAAALWAVRSVPSAACNSSPWGRTRRVPSKFHRDSVVNWVFYGIG